jgi:alpha-L-rhamnosidase
MMNSFNHYSLGSVAQWLYEYVAGIRLDPDRPGYEHVVISPTPGPLEHADAEFESVRGRFRSAWRRANGELQLTVEVPANVTATVIVPGGGELTESGADAATAAGVDQVRRDGGAWVAEVRSGTYRFAVAQEVPAAYAR